MLADLVEKYGKKWTLIAKELQRVPDSCKFRQGNLFPPFQLASSASIAQAHVMLISSELCAVYLAPKASAKLSHWLSSSLHWSPGVDKACMHPIA